MVCWIFELIRGSIGVSPGHSSHETPAHSTGIGTFVAWRLRSSCRILSPTRRPVMSARILFFAYGCFAYALFFLTFLYAIAFVGGFGVPRILDGPLTMPFMAALVIDAGLLGVF